MAAKKKTTTRTRRKATRKAATKKKTTRTPRKASKPAAKKARTLPKRKQPESLRMRAATPSFTVNDIQKSLVWYRDVLGCVLKDRWEEAGQLRGVELRTGSVSIFLGQDDWKKGRDRQKGEGFRIYCTTAQDVDRLAAGIKARGGTLTEEPQDHPWGGRDFAVSDPDGFKITIAALQ